MQVKVEHATPRTATVEITVDEEQVSRTFESVYKEFNRYINVPGFRPGKAPLALLERYVDPERVRRRVLEKLVAETGSKALEQESLEVMSGYNPEIDAPDIENNKPYTYKLIVPLEPEVSLGAYTGLTVEKPKRVVTDELVEQEIERRRKPYERLERVTDRGVEPGDVLSVEMRVQEEGAEEDKGPARRRLIFLGNNIPGFDEALLGMKIGEERTFTLPYPDDYPDETKRGKQATYTVKLIGINVRKLPEVNDAFAKELGYENVETMRRRVREELEDYFERLGNELAEQRLIAEIVKNSTVNFSEILVKEEMESRLESLARELQQRNLTYEQYLAAIGKTAEEHQRALAEQSAYRIAAFLVLRAIATQEGLQVDQEDIDAAFDDMLEKGQITEEQYGEFRQNPRKRLELADALVRQRLHDFLFANNTIREVEVSDLPQEETEEEIATAEGGE
jgi:trigger factor